MSGGVEYFCARYLGPAQDFDDDAMRLYLAIKPLGGNVETVYFVQGEGRVEMCAPRGWREAVEWYCTKNHFKRI